MEGQQARPGDERCLRETPPAIGPAGQFGHAGRHRPRCAAGRCVRRIRHPGAEGSARPRTAAAVRAWPRRRTGAAVQRPGSRRPGSWRGCCTSAQGPLAAADPARAPSEPVPVRRNSRRGRDAAQRPAAAGFGMRQRQQPGQRREQPEQRASAQQPEQPVGRPRAQCSRAAARRPSASRSAWRRGADWRGARRRRLRTALRQAERRTFPLEVLSTVCGGASRISSAGSPMASITACDTASRSAPGLGDVAGRTSASTTRRSVPLPGRGCRIPPRSPCARPRPPHGLLDFLRVQVAPAADHDVLDAAGHVTSPSAHKRGHRC